MNEAHADYELGTDVTQQVKAKGRRDTTVLSVRLPTAEISALETASAMCGRSTAQIVRDAIAAYLPTIGRQVGITVSWGNDGATISTGQSRSLNRATQSETRPWERHIEGVPA